MINKIRFINSDYTDLFSIYDGDSVRLDCGEGLIIEKVCKYIDVTHFYFGNRCYHICEFAENNEKNHNTVSKI